MAAKNIFEGTTTPKLMENFLSNTFDDLYVSGYHELDGAKDFATVIIATKDETYDHTDTEADNLKAFLGLADETINIAGTRTVYMDSNIALTDGSKLAKEGARVIPNLYEAIDGLRLGEEILAEQTKDLISRMETIDDSHKPSTADAGLYVSYLDPTDPLSIRLASFMTSDKIPNYVVSPGGNNDGAYVEGANADAANTAANLHFSANEITFTIANHNSTILEAYALSAAPITDNFDLPSDQLTKHGKSLNLTTGHDYYWVPLEDSEIKEETGGTLKIKAGAHGKIFARGGENAGQLKGTLVVYYSHAVALNDNVVVTAVEGGLTVSGTMTYNLGAIIEAIQELNRRTMFMDIDMSFNGAMSYGDYTSNKIDSSAYSNILDGLPAASNGNLAQHIQPA